tara:strand:- start:62259 stop:62507 length:249 start_codon:yes stop_codon:yes gene_type:complete
MMDRIQLEALRDAYQAARPVRTCSYGSRPWGIQTPEGSTLAGWRAPEGDLPGYEVICWRLKRDAESGRLAVLATIEEKIRGI